MQPDFSRSLSRRGALAAGFGEPARRTRSCAAERRRARDQPEAPSARAVETGRAIVHDLAGAVVAASHAPRRDAGPPRLPKFTREQFGIDAVEYVNSFFKEKSSSSYNAELRKRCDAEGVKSVLIMCDGEGALGDKDEAKRLKAVDNHMKWLEAAKRSDATPSV